MHIKFVIMKKDAEKEYWSRLTTETTKFNNITVDWSQYIDEDEENEEGNQGAGGEWDPNQMNSSTCV